MNIEINIFTVLEKDLKNASERKLPSAHLATLKSKKVYKFIAVLKTLQILKQEWQTDDNKIGLVWRNRKKISQIINAYLYLPFFLLIILCC
jgi:hypothetical protein